MKSIFLLLQSFIILPLDIAAIIIQIISRRALLARVLVPYAIGATSTLAMLWLVLAHRDEITSSLVHTPSAWVASLASFGVVLVGIVVAALLSLIVTLAVAAIAIEFLIESFLRLYLVSLNESRVGVSSVIRGIRDAIIIGLISLVVGICVVIGGFIPFLAIPCAILSGIFLGASIVDTMLCVAGKPFEERMLLIRRNLPLVIPLGMVALAVAVVPFGNVLFLPVMQGVAVRRFSPLLLDSAETPR